MDALLQDLRYAMRTLVKSPGFTVVAVLTLGLGIGANAQVFTSVNALLLRPYPYRDPGSLVAVRTEKPSDGITADEVSYPNFVDWRAESRSFEDLAAHSGRTLNVAGGDEPELVRGEQISAGMFRLLGVTPSLGRDFLEADGQPGAPRVVLLSHSLWQRRFGGDQRILGQAIQLNGVPTTVVGVMSQGFGFPGSRELWVPLQLDPASGRGNQWLEVVGRLRPGATPAQAQAEVEGIAQRLAERYPDTNRGWSASVVPLREHEIGEYRPVLYIMMGAVAFVLLIACANVANLQLARAATRQREIAVRTALGASRGRIVRQLLTESVLLALLGAGVGLAFALWGNDLVNRAVPADRPFWMHFTIDARVLLFTAGVAVATGLLFGLSPALQASFMQLHESLKEGGRGGSGRR
ncbi:MAG: ABC transporter permease, partial [Gemmatimonadales bacterium]